jgi:hypothetical protein
LISFSYVLLVHPGTAVADFHNSNDWMKARYSTATPLATIEKPSPFGYNQKQDADQRFHRQPWIGVIFMSISDTLARPTRFQQLGTLLRNRFERI